MNSSQTQHLGSQRNWRSIGITLSLSLLVLFNLLPVAAQKGTKRITSVWTATTAEGSRVHVVSDSPINDYEGYTRGGRFYVKIPLADLPTARGSLLGRGFDDVQIQRYGDGIIISFRLQPGSSARVEQAANRLEVVFTTPGGSRSAVAGARETDDAVRTRARRISDSAGPAPSTTPNSSSRRETSERRTTGQRHERPTSGSVAQRTTGASARNNNASGTDGSKPRDNRNSSSSEKAAPPPPVAAKSSPSPTPVSSPSPIASPTTNPSGLARSASPNASPNAPATPAVSEPSGQALPVATPSKAATSKDSDWKIRAHYWQVWAELNWVPLLVGVLVAVALLVLLFFWRAAKRSRGDAPEWTPTKQAASETVAVASPSPTSDARQSASADGSATSQTQSPAANTTSSNATPSEPVRHQGEEPEREVFEL
jgi:hypothetical protein